MSDDRRTARWGHWGISYMVNDAEVASLSFPVGPQGPQDGCYGSPERARFQDTIERWVGEGVLPDGAKPKGVW